MIDVSLKLEKEFNLSIHAEHNSKSVFLFCNCNQFYHTSIFLDHMVEIYSTGCRSNDCSNAESSIKFDGMELSGKSEGINIVVLSYPG